MDAINSEHAVIDAKVPAQEKMMSRVDAYRIMRRRIAAAGFTQKLGGWTLQATGITADLDNGGSFENAQIIELTSALLTS